MCSLQHPSVTLPLEGLQLSSPTLVTITSPKGCDITIETHIKQHTDCTVVYFNIYVQRGDYNCSKRLLFWDLQSVIFPLFSIESET